ncbi:MAG: hypothetical protein A3F83_01660 [Candidatus Glassbacteria bacterium RIFCSPLOWO2_12_FULL_58_11]|uniref:Uncharacterized protein n=2 Tax=Candidatus Glassiibacteriota TaxID=1817805 RepID=A0A1F5YV61_9BACT|nr:MAG: hypothetical protein A2Z86_00435 [Candidatus Glassbacteria bacterium GWA2_58_10]OGG04098.1 MAG: hypothetical protein A3F83_01660 [Candidatus Glassbacteria bacterium RIFCSPLOWO2_12_FULL_58_11]
MPQNQCIFLSIGRNSKNEMVQSFDQQHNLVLRSSYAELIDASRLEKILLLVQLPGEYFGRSLPFALVHRHFEIVEVRGDCFELDFQSLVAAILERES